MSINSSQRFARELLPYFEMNPMFKACIEYTTGIVVKISDIENVGEPVIADGVTYHSFTKQIQIELYPSWKEADDMVEPVTFQLLSLMDKDVEDIKNKFISLFGGSKISSGNADPIYLKDNRHFKDTNRFAIELNVDEDKESIIISDMSKSNHHILDHYKEYTIEKLSPLLQVV